MRGIPQVWPQTDRRDGHGPRPHEFRGDLQRHLYISRKNALFNPDHRIKEDCTL